jgi:hypothetical protein
MIDARTTPFAGAAGRVLGGTLSLGSLLTGLVLGFVLVVSNWVLIEAHAAAFATSLNHVLFAFVVARFVLNGLYGEWRGGLFSSAGGSWVEVIQVALRYLALTLVWLLPMILFVPSPEQLGPSLLERRVLVPLLLYVVASVLMPPILLIVAVAAEGFADMFAGRLWRELFSGRRTDLLAVYSTYTGGMVVALLLSAPALIVAFALHWRLGAFVGALAFCFLLGMSLDLLGRLCGFFAVGDLGALEPPAGERSPLPPAAGPVPGAAAPAPVRDAMRQRGTGAPQPAATPPRVGPPAAVAPARAAGRAVAPLVSSSKLPPLLNAKERIDQILAHFAQEPEAALTALRDLRANYAPSAQIAGALAICLSRRGDKEEGLALACEALPLAFERGHSHLAADVFKEFKEHVERLALNREQILTIAAAATAKGDLSTGGEAYSMILTKDAGEVRAVKGLLHVAERIVRETRKPAVAIRVYRFLDQHCGSGPFAESIRRGLEEAERRAARPTPV